MVDWRGWDIYKGRKKGEEQSQTRFGEIGDNTNLRFDAMKAGIVVWGL